MQGGQQGPDEIGPYSPGTIVVWILPSDQASNALNIMSLLPHLLTIGYRGAINRRLGKDRRIRVHNGWDNVALHHWKSLEVLPLVHFFLQDGNIDIERIQTGVPQ